MEPPCADLPSAARAARARAAARRRQGADALTRGFLESAAGNGPEATRLAQRASELAQETPQLVRLLAAQAAEAAGDRSAAEAAYRAMLGFPEMRLAAHRGLMQTALAAGDAKEALASAQAAYALPHTAPWAWRALFQSALASADWPAALALTQEAQERKIVSPQAARARAAVQTASAAEQDLAGAGADGSDAIQAAAKARPDFTPAAVIAARILTREGRGQRAAPILEAAWAARPHPAIWLTWRDLKTDETPKERAARLASLATSAASSRESRMLMVEQALIAGDAQAARAATAALDGEATTQRLAALRARVANAAGERDEARAWITRRAAAPEEPDWTDIDPSGRAFAYSPADWGRLILA